MNVDELLHKLQITEEENKKLHDELHIHCCRTCDNRVDFAYVEIPYACKLLFQELTTMNVVPRIMTEK